jgi:hypothetical protein
VVNLPYKKQQQHRENMIQITVKTNDGKTHKMIVDLADELLNTTGIVSPNSIVQKIIKQEFPNGDIWNSFWNFIQR